VEDFEVPADGEFDQLVQELSAGLLAKGWKMACAESCTGGWIAKCCTDRAGSSAWFERGFVTYSNTAKQEMLGVDPAALDSAGAVSREVALQMADGARRRAGVDIAVAVTGIAGPDGGTLEKPVGTVWFAWSTAAGLDAELVRFKGGRDTVRRQSVAHALQGLLARLEP
jgi:nicotinamide-nucleotide amidase